MPIIIPAPTAGGEYEPVPLGVQQAVCVDVEELGFNETEYKGTKKTVEQIRVVFQLEELKTNNEPFIVSRKFTKSLYEKAALRAFLESWRNKKFDDNQLLADAGFNIEKLIGVNARLQLLETEYNGKTYAQISSIQPTSKHDPVLEPKNYTRKKDRPVPIEQDGKTVQIPETQRAREFAAAAALQQPRTAAAAVVRPPDVNVETDEDIPF